MSSTPHNANLTHARRGTKMQRGSLAVRAFLFIFSLVLLATVGPYLDKGASAQTTANRAGLVVQGPDDTTQTYCIAFEGDTISGLDLLIKSGLPLKVEAYGGMGAEVCQIGATGCDYPNQACACRSYGPNGVYWSYHHLQDNKWKASIMGAGSYRVHPGDVEGWAWSDGAPPKVYTFSQLCPAVEPPPSPTQPQPSATAIPTRPPHTHAHTQANSTHLDRHRSAIKTASQPTDPVSAHRNTHPTVAHKTQPPTSPPTSTSTATPTNRPTSTPTTSGNGHSNRHPSAAARRTPKVPPAQSGL